MEKTNAIADAFVGTWKVIALEDHGSSGNVIYPLGQSPAGLLTYHATGHMSIQLMKRPHPTFAAGHARWATPEEKRAAYDGYVAYFGTYSVDEAAGVVTHYVEASLDPTYIGVDQPRLFELAGDQLLLREVWTQDGEEMIGIRRFERVKEPER